MAISDKIERLLSARTDIKNVIEEKHGIIEEPYGFETFSSCINTIIDGVSLCDGTITEVSSPLITQLRDHAFAGCTELEKVDLPNCSVAPNSIFYNCTGLKEIHLGKVPSLGTTNPFTMASNVEIIDLPECSSVAANGFSRNTNVKSINLPSLTATIGTVFSGHTKLESIYLDSATLIAQNTFASCTNLNTVYIPNVTTINNTAFANCVNLLELNAPALQTITASALNNCMNLEVVHFDTLQKGVNNLLYNRVNLREFYGPELTSTGTQAFMLTKLESINLPNLPILAASAFKQCSSLTYVSLPICSNVGADVFYSCITLPSISFTGLVTTGANAFRSCTSLETATFIGTPDKSLTFGNTAFHGDALLSSIVISGYSTAKFGTNSFGNCTNLYDLWLDTEVICTLSSTSMFNGSPIGSKTGRIHVSESLYNSYITNAAWKRFSVCFVSDVVRE